MTSLPPNYLHAAVAIGIESTPDEIVSTGQPMRQTATGFRYCLAHLTHHEEREEKS